MPGTTSDGMHPDPQEQHGLKSKKTGTYMCSSFALLHSISRLNSRLMNNASSGAFADKDRSSKAASVVADSPVYETSASATATDRGKYILAILECAGTRLCRSHISFRQGQVNIEKHRHDRASSCAQIFSNNSVARALSMTRAEIPLLMYCGHKGRLFPSTKILSTRLHISVGTSVLHISVGTRKNCG